MQPVQKTTSPAAAARPSRPPAIFVIECIFMVRTWSP
jgi:hypothetical protein